GPTAAAGEVAGSLAIYPSTSSNSAPRLVSNGQLELDLPGTAGGVTTLIDINRNGGHAFRLAQMAGTAASPQTAQMLFFADSSASQEPYISAASRAGPAVAYRGQLRLVSGRVNTATPASSLTLVQG